ncbi:hypothetical protein SmJEL517_g00309 [Synchytrium microbalum]|uniref:EF-hand domain-containing protein n=1 Tax=Synchytrium microbalum TaxID=1806994 RepID=A0A507CFQ5_9FUNG|nr:uncharacterized protein SmJEL517_g00309 [Synchytrium microbalum]TPX38321.1 hypothetical protein SmJEL517_g00309 [Synchytrium microbalum]
MDKKPQEPPVEQIHINKSPATGQEIGLAAVMGVSSGYATKKIAKGSALVLGLTFIGFQALSHTGVIQINWNQIEKYMVARVDQDGDGKLTSRDVQLAAGRFIHLLSSDLPSSGAFAASFWLGFRYG